MAGAADSPGEQMPARSINRGADCSKMKSPAAVLARTPAKLRMDSRKFTDGTDLWAVSRTKRRPSPVVAVS